MTSLSAVVRITVAAPKMTILDTFRAVPASSSK